MAPGGSHIAFGRVVRFGSYVSNFHVQVGLALRRRHACGHRGRYARAHAMGAPHGAPLAGRAFRSLLRRDGRNLPCLAPAISGGDFAHVPRWFARGDARSDTRSHA